MSALVDVLQDDEQQQAAKSIGGVLKGIFMTPITTIIEQHIDIINAPSSGIDLGSDESSPPIENTI